MPYPKKPNHLKAIEGTARKDRMTEDIPLPLLDECPVAPSWLPNEHAVSEFNKLAHILFSLGLLNQANVGGLGLMCSLFGKIITIFLEDEVPSAHLVAQYRNLLNDFGLTPVAQGKVNVNVEKPKENAFKKNGTK